MNEPRPDPGAPGSYVEGFLDALDLTAQWFRSGAGVRSDDAAYELDRIYLAITREGASRA